MLLSNDYGLRLERRRDNRSLIERFDSSYVNDFGADPLAFECLGSLESLPYEVACGDDCNILTFIENISLADFKLLILRCEVRH